MSGRARGWVRERNRRSGRRRRPRDPVNSLVARIRASTPFVLRSLHALSRRHPQRGHRGPRRPRQDHVGRRDALAVRGVPRERGRERARHGLDGPRAREGHHDPRQEHGRAPRWAEDQHRRHARTRGLRGRGRARAHDGGRRAPPRGRERGSAAADQVRPAQGARVAPARDPRREQDRPAGRARGRGRARGGGALPRPRRRRAPDRLPDPVRERARGTGLARPRRARHRPRAAVHHAGGPDPGTRVRGRPPAAGARDQPRRLTVRGPAGAVSRAPRPHPPRPTGGLVPPRRHRGAGEGHRALRDGGARPRRRRGGRPGRDHRDRGHRRRHDRGDPRRSRGPASAPRRARGRAEPLDDGGHQHVAALGQGRRQDDRAAAAHPPRPGAGGQRLDPRAGHRASRDVGGAGPRRAPARGPGRDDAPRGVRAHRRASRRW